MNHGEERSAANRLGAGETAAQAPDEHGRSVCQPRRVISDSPDSHAANEPEKRSLVDELLAERKAEAERENQDAAFVRDQEVCMICGRRGTRAFIVVSGKAGEAATQVMCANRAACDRRAKTAIRHEAARGNWS